MAAESWPVGSKVVGKLWRRIYAVQSWWCVDGLIYLDLVYARQAMRLCCLPVLGSFRRGSPVGWNIIWIDCFMRSFPVNATFGSFRFPL